MPPPPAAPVHADACCTVLPAACCLRAVSQAANSSFIGFMEGCVRAQIDNGTAPIMLSSGTEDYFEGANFFDTGLQQSPAAGVTWVAGKNPGPYAMTAFKHHVRDPVVWWDSFELTARNFDTNGKECGGGAGAAPSRLGIGTGADAGANLMPATMSSYAWTYEWQP